MHISFRTLAGACALALTALSGSAQVFVGSDNFDDGVLTIQGASNQAVGQYRFVNNNNPSVGGTGGAWTETGGHVEYTNTNTTGFNRGQLGWVSPSTSVNSAPSGNNLGIGGAGLTSGDPYNSSWVAQVSATNNLTSLSTGFAYAGIDLYALNASVGGNNAYYSMALNTSTAGAKWIETEWGKWDSTLNAGAGNFVVTNHFIATTDVTDVILRMSFDASTKILTMAYSNDGATFFTAASYDLDGAEVGNTAPQVNGFGFEMFGSVNNIGSALTANQLTFDNLSVTAVPEPSTYAAIAGACGLGLAAWHRRRKLA